jgi:thiol-disulfide isomerase/thioredoxin
MSKGNSRAARPTLIRLAEAAEGSTWSEPVAAMLCDARASLGDLKEARSAIDSFKKTWPKSAHMAQVWVADGKTHMHEGKRLKRAPGQDPKDPPNNEQKKSYGEAISRFDTVIKSFPGHPAVVDALLNKSALLVDLGDLAAAEKSASQLADEHPESQHGPRALSNVARNAMGQGEFPIAERIYNKLVTDFPTDRAAKAAKGQLKSLKMLGKDAPELEVTEWVGEDLGSLASLRGQNVVVVFWATWCPACKRTMPSIQEFYERNKGDDFAMIAVTRNSKGQTTDKVRDYMAENNYTFPVAIDTGASSRAYGVTGIPAAAMVDKSGKVVFRNHPAQLTDALVKKHQ